MNKKTAIYIPYLWKTLKWTFGNTIFGLFPLLFMCIVYVASDKTIGGDHIDTMIYEGSVLFVSIAIVGSVLVDFYLSGQRPNGISRFSVYFFPTLILSVVSLNYFLIHIKAIDKSRFSLTSYTTEIVVTLSFLYITFVKTSLYMKEDVKHEPKL